VLPLAGLLASTTFLSIEGQTLEEKHGQYHYRVVRVQNPPTVDGDLSDSAWQGVAAIDQFIQQVPDFGMPATQKTQVRLIYDSTALYIGVYCYRTDPSGIVRNVLRFRDDNIWSKDDIIRFFIDTFHDHRRAYVFATNALGTKQDAQLDNEATPTGTRFGMSELVCRRMAGALNFASPSAFSASPLLAMGCGVLMWNAGSKAGTRESSGRPSLREFL